MPEAEWEPETDNWVRWAREPGFDAYWYFRDAFFDTILPAPGRRTVEIGCGEGRVARDLARRGHHVAAVDAAHGLVRHAREADVSGHYLVADSAALPFADGSFDAAVLYNSLQVVADMPTTIGEAARVLTAGGYLCVCMSHPVTDMGKFVEVGGSRLYALRSDYFETTRVEETVERAGRRMTFRGWSYPLQQYTAALYESGFSIELIHEPRPEAPPSRYRRWLDIPLFMNLRAVKREAATTSPAPHAGPAPRS